MMHMCPASYSGPSFGARTVVFARAGSGRGEARSRCLDLEELEILMGMVGAGHSLTRTARTEDVSMWLERDLKALVSAECGHGASASQRSRRAPRGLARSA